MTNTTTQYVSIASRGIALARRPEGVSLDALKSLPSSIVRGGKAQIGSWFTYLVRNAFETETVTQTEIDGVTMLFVTA
jgi:hypothetical protein